MLRFLSIFPVWTAVLMMMFVNLVPHHHHQTMICLVQEVCQMDGCCDDEHTGHSDANHEEDENHCISHEKYFPSDDLRVDFAILSSPAIVIPFPEIKPSTDIHKFFLDGKATYSPPILSWRINC